MIRHESDRRPIEENTAELNATMVISLVLIVAYVVAVWAMTGKPD